MVDSFATVNEMRSRYLIDTAISGNRSPTDVTNWNIDKAVILLVQVVTSATDWTLTIYPDNGYDALGIMPPLVLFDNASGNDVINIYTPYQDFDAGQAIHFNFTDNAAANTADVYFRGVQG